MQGHGHKCKSDAIQLACGALDSWEVQSAGAAQPFDVQQVLDHFFGSRGGKRFVLHYPDPARIGKREHRQMVRVVLPKQSCFKRVIAMFVAIVCYKDNLSTLAGTPNEDIGCV